MNSIKWNLFGIFYFCSIISLFANDSIKIQAKVLVAEPQHSITEQVIAEILSNGHYNRVNIDDAFSSKVYDKYLEMLDNGRQYFLNSDINNFNKYRNLLDNELKGGTNEAGFTMYNTYMKRVFERLEFVNQALKDTFNYDIEDYFQFDREKLPWFEDVTDQNNWWLKKLKYEGLSLKISGKIGTEINETLLKRYENFRKQLSKLKNEDAFSLYMNAFTACVDPHTDYFSPRTAEDFHVNMSQQLKGIGATLTMDGEYTKIRELVKGGPADKSKLIFDGDKITAVGQGINGEMVDVVGWRLDDVVGLIRGEKDTWVRLRIIPKTAGPGEPQKIIEIKRDVVRLEDQRAKCEIKNVKRGKKDYKLGFITLPVFYQGTTKDVSNLIDSLKNSKIQGLVFDLRNNTGGSLQEVITLAGLFIEKGPIVQVKNLFGQVDVNEDRDATQQYAGPVVVLVNRVSASASEIFAAALQDYHRALIVGERTYGKGTVQNTQDLNYYIGNTSGPKMGEIKPTIAKFYRINGGSTQNRGVIPDIEYPSLIDSTEFGESSELYALPYDEIPVSNYTIYKELDLVKSTLIKNNELRMDKNIEHLFLLEDLDEKNKMKEEKLLPMQLSVAKIKQDAAKVKEKARAEKRKMEGQGNKKISNKDLDDMPAKYDMLMDEGQQLVIDWLELKKS